MEPQQVNGVPFGDLKRQYEAHAAEYDAAVRRVMQRGWFVLGSEGEAFEAEWAAWTGAPHCVGCNSGTDAIFLALAAHGIKVGDRVVTAANTCVPTVSSISMLGARIGLADVDGKTGLMDPAALEAELSRTPAQAVVVVHLYGQAADLDALGKVAQRHGALLIEDAAQAHGARFQGKRIGSHGGTVAWSFYPSKNLGAFGDAGAVTTHDPEVAQRLRMLRNYGQERRYMHTVCGINSRMDEVQAAVLRARLPRLEEENECRRAIARRYRSEIRHPEIRFIGSGPDEGGCSHLFPIAIRHRDSFQEELRLREVQTVIHYPIPIHLQPAYSSLGYSKGAFPCAEQLCSSILSLPLFAEMTPQETEMVISSITAPVG